MTRIFANANYDFIGMRRWAYGVTAALLLIGLIGYFAFGVNYSVEFTGGTLVQIETKNAVDVANLRTGLDQAGVLHAEIQQFGSDREYVIRARTAAQGTDADNTEQTTKAISGALDKVLGAGAYTISRTEGVGPKVGAELRQKAIFAILLSFVAVLAYLAYRFEWRFGLAAVIATAHDILTTLGFIFIMKIEVSLVVVGAVLSMVGYSLNDTIIIFDRVREDLRKMRGVPFGTVLNRAINETLPRSVLTHGTGALDAARAGAARRRGHPALRAGHVLRRVHRHVLLDLHRLAGAALDRAAVAGRRGEASGVPGAEAGLTRGVHRAGRRSSHGLTEGSDDGRLIAPGTEHPAPGAGRHPLPSRGSGLRARPRRGARPRERRGSRAYRRDRRDA
jgi:preprotein translocase subunit SecF